MLVSLSRCESLVIIISSNDKALQLAVLEVLKTKSCYNTQQQQNIEYLERTIKDE